MEQIIIGRVSGKEAPYDLLLLADPSREAVDDYLARGACYVARTGTESIIGVYVLLRTRPFTVELVNLAVASAWQGKGYGKQLVLHAIETARLSGCRVLELGTGNSGIRQLALYQKCGFSITGIDIDFFRKYYPEKIVENGIECRHMVRLSLEL